MFVPISELQSQEFEEILAWLSPKDPWLQKVELSNQKQPGTGATLITHSDLLEWARGNRALIWCRGGRKSAMSISFRPMLREANLTPSWRWQDNTCVSEASS